MMDLTQASAMWKELISRIEKLEKDSHPPKDLCEFKDWEELDHRIRQLEEKANGNDD